MAQFFFLCACRQNAPRRQDRDAALGRLCCAIVPIASIGMRQPWHVLHSLPRLKRGSVGGKNCDIKNYRRVGVRQGVE